MHYRDSDGHWLGASTGTLRGAAIIRDLHACACWMNNCRIMSAMIRVQAMLNDGASIRRTVFVAIALIIRLAIVPKIPDDVTANTANDWIAGARTISLVTMMPPLLNALRPYFFSLASTRESMTILVHSLQCV